MVVQYTNRYTINKSVYRATGSGSDGVPFMVPNYKKAPTGVVFSRGAD